MKMEMKERIKIFSRNILGRFDQDVKNIYLERTMAMIDPSVTG